jgi:hypothetical protein
MGFIGELVLINQQSYNVRFCDYIPARYSLPKIFQALFAMPESVGRRSFLFVNPLVAYRATSFFQVSNIFVVLAEFLVESLGIS